MNKLTKLHVGLALVTATAGMCAMEGGAGNEAGAAASQPSFATRYVVDPMKKYPVGTGVLAALLAGTVAYKTVPEVKKRVDAGVDWITKRGKEGCAVVNKAAVKPIKNLLKKLDEQPLSRADALGLIAVTAAFAAIYKDLGGVRTKSVNLLQAGKDWSVKKTGPLYEQVKNWVLASRTNQIIAGTAALGAFAGTTYLVYKLCKAYQEKAQKEKAEEAIQFDEN